MFYCVCSYSSNYSLYKNQTYSDKILLFFQEKNQIEDTIKSFFSNLFNDIIFCSLSIAFYCIIIFLLIYIAYQKYHVFQKNYHNKQISEKYWHHLFTEENKDFLSFEDFRKKKYNSFIFQYLFDENHTLREDLKKQITKTDNFHILNQQLQILSDQITTKKIKINLLIYNLNEILKWLKETENKYKKNNDLVVFRKIMYEVFKETDLCIKQQSKKHHHSLQNVFIKNTKKIPIPNSYKIEFFLLFSIGILLNIAGIILNIIQLIKNINIYRSNTKSKITKVLDLDLLKDSFIIGQEINYILKNLNQKTLTINILSKTIFFVSFVYLIFLLCKYCRINSSKINENDTLFYDSLCCDPFLLFFESGDGAILNFSFMFDILFMEAFMIFSQFFDNTGKILLGILTLMLVLKIHGIFTFIWLLKINSRVNIIIKNFNFIYVYLNNNSIELRK